MATTTTATKLSKLAADFVNETGGAWEHQDWETFCEKAAKAGVDITEENSAALGRLLEAVRYFHSEDVTAVPAKKTAVSAPKAAKPAPKATASRCKKKC